MDISLVVPINNEEGNIKALYESATDFFAGLLCEYEIIFIDDGSTDGSRKMLEEIKTIDDRVKVCRFASRRGQAAGLEAGFKTALGEYVLTTDGDMQYDMRDFKNIVELLRDFDVVTGRRINRLEADGIIKFVSSRIGNFVRNKVLGERFRDAGCHMRGYRKTCLDKLKLRDSSEAFMLSMLRIDGCRIKETDVRCRPRQSGTSHFGIGNRILGPAGVLFALKKAGSERIPKRKIRKTGER